MSGGSPGSGGPADFHRRNISGFVDLALKRENMEIKDIFT